MKIKFIERETSLKTHEVLERIELSNMILDHYYPGM